MFQDCSCELVCGFEMTVLCRWHHDFPGAPRGQVPSTAFAAAVRHAPSVSCSHPHAVAFLENKPYSGGLCSGRTAEDDADDDDEGSDSSSGGVKASAADNDD